jgi:hypothetical protein
MYYIHLLTIIILFILIYNLNKKTKNIEKYDVEIEQQTSLGKCGNICSSIYGCAGFATTDDGNKCWISKLPITSPPIPSKFMSNFDSTNIHCNKLRPITSDFGISDDNYTENKVYDCYTGEKADDLGRKYFDFNVKPEDLSDSSFYFIKSESYNLHTIDFDRDTKITVDSNFNVDINPDDISYLEDGNNEYLGKYLSESICKTNVELSDCLNNCTLNPDCVGVEYLKEYNGNYNICCPKSLIEKKIPRREKFKLGSYYSKKNKFNSNKKNKIFI